MDIIRRGPNSKSCPKGYRKLDANGLCIKSERVKEGSFELPADFKKCPKGFVRKPKTRQCLKPTKKKKKVPAKKTVKKRYNDDVVELADDAKQCPQGYARVTGTRQCKKQTTVQAKKTIKKRYTGDIVELTTDAKQCPRGYARIKGTRKCRKRDMGDNIVIMVKKNIHPKGVPMPPGAKRCPKGSKKILDTSLCQPVIGIKSAKAPSKQPLLPTPPYNLVAMPPKEISPSKRVLKTRSPSVNKFLGTKKTPVLPFCPAKIGDYEIGSEKHPNKVMVPTKTGRTEWVGWSTKAAKDYMMQQFLSNVPIDCSTVRGPNQYFSNCWFNTFFMVFFISDKGRRTFRYLRNAMITGEFPATAEKTRSEIPKSYRKGLFYLNALIQNSLHGALPKIYDTNSVVKSLNAASSKVIGAAVFPKLREYSNPLTFYTKLIIALEGTLQGRVKLAKIIVGLDTLSQLKSAQHGVDSPASWHQQLYERTVQYRYNTNKDVMPDFISIDLAELVGVPKGHKATVDWWIKEGKKKWGFHGYGHKDGDSPRFQLKGKDGKKYIYELDSLVSRDTTKQHFACFLTCNKTEYAFDGACSTLISPVNWKKLARDHAPRTLLHRNPSKFDLLRNYNVSFFYRVE